MTVWYLKFTVIAASPAPLRNEPAITGISVPGWQLIDHVDKAVMHGNTGRALEVPWLLYERPHSLKAVGGLLRSRRCIIAGIPQAITITIGLARIRDQTAIVEDIGITVIVVIGITGITDPVEIRIQLVAIGQELAIVGCISKTVVIVVAVTGITTAILVGIGLEHGIDPGTVVAGVDVTISSESGTR